MDHASDNHYLRRALALARESGELGDDPFGAVITIDNELVCASQNYSKRKQRGWLHAEWVAIQTVVERLGASVLARATLYSSTEPCPMCCAVMHWSDVGRLVYSCDSASFRRYRRHKAFIPCRTIFEGMGTTIEVVGPHLEHEGVEVHKSHWSG